MRAETGPSACSRCEEADTVLTPLSLDLVLLVSLIGLFILAIGAGWGHKIREFLHFVREALYDEWQWPR